MNGRTALRVVFVALALATCAGVLPARVDAQSVTVRYQRLADREKAARAATNPPIATLRTLARSYEAFTRAHYLSGYADNALWQAAGLYDAIYARTKDVRDRDQSIRLLKWLKREYPKGTLAKQVDARLHAIAPAAEPRAAAAAPPPAPTPTPTPAPPPRLAPATSAAGIEPRPDPKVASAPLAPVPPAASVPMPAISVKDITYAALPKGDRLILEFTAEAAYSTSRTTNPDRVFVDLSNAGMLPPLADRAARISGTLVKTVTITRAANGTARLILQMSGDPRYSTFPLYDPFRLVIDVESDAVVAASRVTPPAATRTAPRDVVLASVPAASEAPRPEALVRNVTPPATTAGDYSLARQLGLGVSRIVIDPGHGGHDPGATANGITEAALVLDVALRLEALLAEHEGTDVVLTRRSDEFVSLEERTAIANRESADMFISIHANASPQKTTSGVETFFLDFASNPHAQSVAARENSTSAQNMRVLPELVKTIALNNKLQESRELAGVVQASLVKKLRPRDAGARDLGVKRAPFVVLIGAQMPSVLAEVSFVTNKAEASLLKQGAYRQRIAQALADAIVKYQGTLKKVSTATTARNDR